MEKFKALLANKKALIVGAFVVVVVVTMILG